MQIDMTSKVLYPSRKGIEQPISCRVQSVVSRRATEYDPNFLPQLDFFYLKGFRCSYSIVDAATSLWQRMNTFVRRDDPASVARLQARLRSGNLKMTPTQEEIKDYIAYLRRDGLSGQIDWHGLAAELRSFQDILPEELTASLNYVASRYVSVSDKLTRNFIGGELAEQESELKDIWTTGMTDLVNGYTGFLQSNLGTSDIDAQAVRTSLAALIEQKISIYCTMVGQINIDAAQAGPDSIWLRNHDAYMAARLREAVVFDETSSIPASGVYSIQDLIVAGQIAQAYRFEIEDAYAGWRNEAQLALNLAFADMKEETLIQQKLVSGKMATLLRNSRSQGHSVALAAVGKYLKVSNPPGEFEGERVLVDCPVFYSIYEAVLNDYHHNGGNGAEAICAGVTKGKMATAQAYTRSPSAARWGKPMEQYWRTFYTAPSLENQTPTERQIEQMLAQIGRSPRRNNSTHQNYINDWLYFLVSIGKNPVQWSADCSGSQKISAPRLHDGAGTDGGTRMIMF